MNETYVEVLVKRKSTVAMVMLKYFLIVLTALFAFFGFVGVTIALVLAVVSLVLAYLVGLMSDLEFEYTYIDKELQVDKIMGKSKRKRVATLDLNKLEVLAPITSHKLDEFKNRKYKELDFSSNEIKQPDIRYVLYMNGESRIVFEPSEEMVKAIYNIAPRKVSLH
ncbi:MAG: DUF6106 family protein [Lachnospiraceae bacterium]